MARKRQDQWLALTVAFMLGLLPGLGFLAWQRTMAPTTSAADAASELLRAQRTTWDAEKAQLTARLDSAEGEVTRLETQVGTLTAALEKARATKPAEKPSSPGAKAEPQFIERRIDGEGQAGGPLTLVVRVKGDADKVTMRLARIHPDSDWVKTYQLKDTGASGGVHTWKLAITAPEERGDYRYFADAWLDDAHVSMPGTAQYVITLE